MNGSKNDISRIRCTPSGETILWIWRSKNSWPHFTGCALPYQLLVIDYSKQVLRIFFKCCLMGNLVGVSMLNTPIQNCWLKWLLVPIIAIFTKYDHLVDHIHIYDNPEGKTKAELGAKASAKLEASCVKPFKAKISGNTNIPVIRVSASECDN